MKKQEVKEILILLGFSEITDSKIRKKYLKDEKNNDTEIWQWRDYTKSHMILLSYYYEDVANLLGTATDFIANISKKLTLKKIEIFTKELKNI